MRVDIRTSGFNLTEGLRAHIQKRLEFALDRARHDVNTVSVSLSDINGPRGGNDKRCQIRIPLPGHRAVLVRDTEADLYVAIDLAVDRASHTLERRLCRQRDSVIHHGRSWSRCSGIDDSSTA